MKKTKIALLIIAVTTLLFQLNCFAERPIKIVVGGEKLETDVAPIIIEGRTMLPVRAVFEAIGAKVSYDANTRKITAVRTKYTNTDHLFHDYPAEKDNRVVELIIGSNIMTVNGEEKTLDVAATILNSRALVPVRACAEAFGLDVEWIDATRTIKIKKYTCLTAEHHNANGFWVKYSYDENGNEIYYENSDGGWKKCTYDENGNLILLEYSGPCIIVNKSLYLYYHEYLSPFVSGGAEGTMYEGGISGWIKYNYSSEGYLTYREDSDGYWIKYSYDENGRRIYEEYPSGSWYKYSYDEYGRRIYEERSNGSWTKYSYDNNSNLIYEERSNGSWYKYSYDENGRGIYEEHSNGSWYKYSYDENGSGIYEERSDGSWTKYSYDNNSNLIYEERSDGSWTKYSYDENGRRIYEEHSDGSWTKYTVMVK